MRVITIVPVLAAVAMPTLASAQTGENTKNTKNWNSAIGIATVAMPTYTGSNRYRTRAVPIVDLNFKNRAYIGSSAAGIGGGIGLYVIKNQTLTLSTEIAGAQERRESFGDGLAGMGKRGGGTFAGSNVSYQLGSITAGAGVAVGLGKDQGSTASLNLATKKVYGQRWIAGLSTGATFANSSNMAFDFGVNSTQAARRQALIDAGDSRLYATEGRAYDPAGGLKQAQVSTSLGYLLTQRTTVIGFASGSRLGSHAADSPLARQRNSVMGGIGMAFGI